MSLRVSETHFVFLYLAQSECIGEPVCAELHPLRGAGIFYDRLRLVTDARSAQGEAVPALGKNMHFERHFVFGERLGIFYGIYYRNGFVRCAAEDERGRSAAVHIFVK